MVAEMTRHLLQRTDDGLRRGLAGVCSQMRAVGTDEHEGGPRLHLVGPPDPKLAVVDHWVAHAESTRGMTDLLRVPLRDELPRVDAHHQQVVADRLFHLPQLRQHVLAVDSAVGPELEDRDASLEIVYGEGTMHVQPVQLLGKGRDGT